MIKVLHVLDHFQPFLSGYAFRTRYMLESQRRMLQVKPVVLVAPQNGDTTPGLGDWEGIPVYTSPKPDGWTSRLPLLKEALNMRRLRAAILDLALREQPDLIHAHSPVLNAWPAIWAGRKLGIPVVYEIRAFWEDAAVMHGSTTEGSLRYEATKLIETKACKGADAVVTVCDGLRSQLHARRIDRGKIFLLPNGVDSSKFRPGADGSALRRKLGLPAEDPVVGFIGTPYRYEGLRLLVEAMALLATGIPRLRCVIVGDAFDGEISELKARAAALGVADRILFTGRVPHDQVTHYYAAIDVLAYPRVRSRLLDLVAPLKILEAMSLGRPVLGSDVGGIREIIRDGENGRLFAADQPADLARVLSGLLADLPERTRLGVSGMQYARDHRQWDNLIEGHRATYRHVGFTV